MNARRTDLALGTGALALAAAWLAETARIPESLLADAVGAAGLPRVLGWACAAIGVLLCARGLARPSSPAQAAGSLRPHVRALGLLAILSGYVLLAPWLGYAVSTGLLVAAGAAHAGARRGMGLVLVPAIAAVVFWLLFVVAFGIPMPGGALFGGH